MKRIREYIKKSNFLKVKSAESTHVGEFNTTKEADKILDMHTPEPSETSVEEGSEIIETIVTACEKMDENVTKDTKEIIKLRKCSKRKKMKS